jgi:RND family efflux transporter MFP subunit
MKIMQNIWKLTAAVALTLALSACGGSVKDDKSALGDKKAQLEKLKKEQQKLNDNVAKLEEEILKLDPNAAAAKAKLVSVSPVGVDTFTHFIDLQGTIDARNVAYASPRGQGGQIRAIYVKQGDVVRRGQTILKLDDALARQNLSAAQQAIAGVKSQLALAQSVYQRQQNLWKEKIGTEVQVLQARTNAELLQSQLNSAEANVQIAQEQLNQTNVAAEIGGTVDLVNVKVGEFFSPQSAATPGTGIRIVNTGDLKVLVQVPENYMGRVNVGNTLKVTLPEANNKIITSKVTVAGKLIDPITRSFYIEGNLPNDKSLRPNQIAMVQIRDYTAPEAITAPVNTLQNDEKGKFLMVAISEGGKLIARKRQVVIGELYRDRLEVKSGLVAGDKIITDGFQGLYDGQLITTDLK